MKNLLLKLTGFVLVLGVVALLATWMFGRQLIVWAKSDVERMLSESIGDTVTFEDGAISLVPALSLSLSGLEGRSVHGCAPWKVSGVSFNLGLLPLLRGEIDIRRIAVEGAEGAMAVIDGAPVRSAPSGKRCVAGENPAPAMVATQSSLSGNSVRKIDLPLSVTLEQLEVSGSSLQIFIDNKQHRVELVSSMVSFDATENTLDVPLIELRGVVDGLAGELEIEGLKCSSNYDDVSVKSAWIHLADQKIQVSGNYNRSNAAGQMQLSASEVSLAEIHRIIGKSFPVKAGVVNSKLNATFAGELITIAGDVSLQGFVSEPADFSLAKISASELEVQVKDSSLSSLRTRIAIDQFDGKSDGDSYHTDHVQGVLTSKMGKEIEFGGNLKVDGFGFADDETSIQKVHAELKGIAGSINARGDVAVSVNLDAHDILLKNPAIVITAVQQVQAPITVRVPAHGGYSVTGPVAISNGEMTIADRALKGVSATVAMSIAGALKDFRSTDIVAESFHVPLSAATHFAMTRDEYRISDSSFKIADGALSASFSLGRTGEKPIDLSLNGKGLSLPTVYRAVMQKEGTPIRGTTTALSLGLKGNKSDLPASLSGSGTIQIDDFIFQTVDIEALLKRAIADIPLVGPDMVPADTPSSAGSGSLSSSLAVAKGTLTAPDIKLQLSNMTVNGNVLLKSDQSLSGAVSIVFLQETFRLFGLGFERFGNFLAREGAITIPFLIGRTVSDPSIRPDIGAIARSLSGLNIIESVAEEGEELVEDVAEEL